MNLGFSIWKLAQNYKDCNTNPFVDAVEGGRIKVSIDFRDNKDLTEAENVCKAKKYDLFYLVFQDTKWHCPCICMFIDTPKDVNELYNNIQNKQLTWRQAIILYKTENHEIDLSILKGDIKATKRWDYVIKTDNQIYVIETNFYATQGSKLNETARSYELIANKVKNINGLTFIWITDGTGWNNARLPLNETFNVLDTLYNINDLDNGVLERLN